MLKYSMPFGKFFEAFCITFSADVRISFALEPAVWNKAIPIPGLPSIFVLALYANDPNSTLATSFNFTTDPSIEDLRMIFS
jgi:hypothetical protein